MKRIVLFLPFALFLISNVTAIDIWNGLTSDMTKPEAIAKACEILGVSEPISDKPGSQYNQFDFFHDNLRDLNRQFPPTQSEVRIVSTLPSYYPPLVDSDGNVSLFFNNDKLFGVNILWAMKSADLFLLVKKQYGAPSKTLDEIHKAADPLYDSDSHRVWYVWKLKGKTIWMDEMRGKGSRGAFTDMYIADQTAIDQYVGASQHKDQEQQEKAKADEDAKLKAASSGATF